MEYTFEFSKQFAKEFDNYPTKQQDVILDFLLTYSKYGLNDFSKYKGKITYSWKNLKPQNPAYKFAKSNNLWHAHIGLPNYRKSLHGRYYTSDMILHFQWINSRKIRVVDITDHYKADGTFWLPSSGYLE